MNKRTQEALANIGGGMALVFAVLLAVNQLIRDHNGLWVLPIVGLIFWRELVFVGIRVELDQLRKSKV